jgi:subtilisin family serine protease
MTKAAATQSRFGAAFEWLGIERAWTRTRGAPVVIGIVVHGVQIDHPLIGPNIHRDPALHIVATGDHEVAGTHAAGVAAGRSSDAANFSGVAPDARILPVCFAGRPGTHAFDLAHAIEYAVEMGASVVNISAAGDVSKPAVKRAIQYAATRNVLVVCSVSEDSVAAEGNDPMPNKVTVLSISEQYQPLARNARDAAQIAAPGFARVPDWRGSGHALHEDPAIGASYVSGCAALVKAQNPAWGYHEIKEHLFASATPQPLLEGHCEGARVLNVAHALLGPIELPADRTALQWSSLNDELLTWKLRYRSGYCASAVALYRPHGDEHWRELATARAGAQKMTIPATALRRSSGTLRIACRESNFHSDEIPLTIE